MNPDLAHNPQPMPKHDDCRAAALARTLRREAARNRTPAGAAFLTDCAAAIEHLLSENKMARDFVSATDVVVNAYNAKAAEATGLAADKANLTAQVADLSTKVATPEVLAAQDKVVALSEQISPSTPPA